MTKIIVYIYPKNLQLQVSLTRFHAFCRSIKIIPVSKPSSKPFRILSVKKDKHRLVEWLVMNPDW